MEYDVDDGCQKCKENHVLDNGLCFAPSKM